MTVTRIALAVLALSACSKSKTTTHADAPAQTPDGPAVTMSCDGVQASDTSSNKVDVLTYPTMDALAMCDPTQMASFTNIIGIVDQFAEKGANAVEVLSPQSCNDVNGIDTQSTASAWDGTCPSTTTGCPGQFSTVNALKASWPAAAASATIVGVVETVRASSSGGGTFYLQDGGSCTTNCAVGIYVPKTVTTALPTVGALVTTTGMTGVYNGAKQITATSFAVIGTTSFKLAPATSLPAQMVGPMATTSAGPYEGMRVKVTGTLATSKMCPPELTYTSTGG